MEKLNVRKLPLRASSLLFPLSHPRSFRRTFRRRFNAATMTLFLTAKENCFLLRGVPFGNEREGFRGSKTAERDSVFPDASPMPVSILRPIGLLRRQGAGIIASRSALG